MDEAAGESAFESKNRSSGLANAVMMPAGMKKKKSAPETNPAPGSESGLYATDKARWTAVLRRDPLADGKFFYSVKTTGVYCRPSCASRRARRENVRFHASREEAERAGFRACLRCRPNGPALGEEHAATVAAACRTIETADEPPSLEALANAAGLSRFHFQRMFKKIAGLTPKAYALARRAERMRQELPRRSSVTEAIYESGYHSNGRFYAESSRELGMAPKTFRRGGPGETIRFAVGECSLGSILVAASGKGVCAIALGDDPDRLCRELQDRFPLARIAGGDRDFARLIARVIGFVDSPRLGLDLPLDVRGTAFQRRVWQALREIPPGSTQSYAEVAERIGLPKAVRAVASACAANTIAVAIPCHRVLRRDGSLSGYRWGVERKRKLLHREATA
jgi:AraC family transcriptional regulator, regulatory protein of adaptative response / methylated-DNA-[protein]-cysteine methyltransferase